MRDNDYIDIEILTFKSGFLKKVGLEAMEKKIKESNRIIDLFFSFLEKNEIPINKFDWDILYQTNLKEELERYLADNLDGFFTDEYIQIIKTFCKELKKIYS